MRPDALSVTFAALADPTRRAILARLSRGAATVNEIAEPFAISLPAVSRHLKVLEQALLITRERAAQWRRCHLSPAPLEGAAAWVEQYRTFWETRFDALDRLLAAGADGQAGSPAVEQATPLIPSPPDLEPPHAAAGTRRHRARRRR